MLSLLINKILQADPQARERLGSLGKRSVLLDLTPLPPFGLLIDEGQIMLDESPEEPSLTLRGHPGAFARYVINGRLDDVQVQGDAHLAQELRDFFSALDIDWEEYLSQTLGDTPARVTSRTISDIAEGARQCGRAVHRNIQDYLHEESDLMPHREEINAFVRDIDDLRDDLERLEMRLERLLP